jgi:hypothetical protein
MTNKDAAFLLGACRPNGADANDPEFSDALTQAERDPTLKAWFAEQRSTDSAIAARLKAVPVPADLRSRILTGGRVSRPKPWFSTQRILAIAAVLAIFAGLASWFTGARRTDNVASNPVTGPRPASEWQDTAMATLSQLLTGKAAFDAQSPKIADLQQWLHANGSPTGNLPPNVQGMSSLGCKTIAWNGYPASLICFHGPNGELVHLAMVNRAAIADPPPQGQPLYAERSGWKMACWSDGKMAMMLLTKAPESQLRALLAVGIFP